MTLLILAQNIDFNIRPVEFNLNKGSEFRVSTKFQMHPSEMSPEVNKEETDKKSHVVL